MRAYYAWPGNAFWETLWRVGLTPRRLRPAEYREVLEYGLGLTDLCKTRSGSDLQVGTDAFEVERLVAQLERNRPGWIAFTSKTSATGALGHPVEYGPQEERLGGARAFVLPSPSGAARRYWDIAYWQELAKAL